MMNDEHIVFRYRTAKESDRRQRLKDLADDNHCTVQTIKDILLANGVTEDELPKKRGRKPTRKPGEIAHIPVVAPAEKKLIEPPKPEIKLPEKPKVEEEPTMVKVNTKRLAAMAEIPGAGISLNEYINTPPLISQMIAELNADMQNLVEEIDKKQKLLDAMEKSYVALKELETVANSVQK